MTVSRATATPVRSTSNNLPTTAPTAKSSSGDSDPWGHYFDILELSQPLPPRIEAKPRPTITPADHEFADAASRLQQWQSAYDTLQAGGHF